MAGAVLLGAWGGYNEKWHFSKAADEVRRSVIGVSGLGSSRLREQQVQKP